MSTGRPAGELVDACGRQYLTGEEGDRFLAKGRTCDVDLEASEMRIATLKRRRSHWRIAPTPEDWVHEFVAGCGEQGIGSDPESVQDNGDPGARSRRSGNQGVTLSLESSQGLCVDLR